MTRTICRKDDENLYQPRIHSRRIRDLHQLVEVEGVPMTYLVDLAIAEFVERRKQQSVEVVPETGEPIEVESLDHGMVLDAQEDQEDLGIYLDQYQEDFAVNDGF